MSTIIEVEKLKKTFRSFQLHDIAFHVSEGCITGLIGIDGSGKSTIIKCLINLIQRDSGKVEFWGENINDKNYSVMNRVDIGNYGFTGICNDYNSIKPFCANMAVERSTVSEIMRAYLWRRANA